MYARPRRALDVKGIGPLSFDGSRLDSGACFQTEAQERSALLHTDSVSHRWVKAGLNRHGPSELTQSCSTPRLVKQLTD